MDEINKELEISIHGKIKCPLAISWIVLFVQTFLIYSIIYTDFYISYWESIFNLFLTLSLQLIAILLSISNNLNSKKVYKLLKFSFILSMINVGIVILSIVVILCAFNYKIRGFLSTSPILESLYTIHKNIIGGSMIFIRVMEILPFLIFLCYRNLIFQKNNPKNEKFLSSNPQGITANEENKDLMNENSVK
jgi:amino acid transporter